MTASRGRFLGDRSRAQYVAFVGRRIGRVLVTLWIAVTAVFLLGAVIGDPVAQLLGENADPAQIEAMREALGYNRPLLVQYGSYLASLATGDLGDSIRYSQPNIDLILDRLPFTLQLAGAAIGLGLVIGLPIGVLAAWKEDSVVDRVSVVGALLGQSMPSFWVGLVLIIIFAVQLGWVPAAGAGTPAHLILPALTLAAYPVSQIARITRSSMAEVLEEEYIASARARGLPERRVVLNHALRNAALPVVTIVGLQAGALLSSAVTVEFVFSWPGLGQLATQAVLARDIPLVQAVVITAATAFVLINLAVDVLYGWLDPRLRVR